MRLVHLSTLESPIIPLPAPLLKIGRMNTKDNNHLISDEFLLMLGNGSVGVMQYNQTTMFMTNSEVFDTKLFNGDPMQKIITIPNLPRWE